MPVTVTRCRYFYFHDMKTTYQIDKGKSAERRDHNYGPKTFRVMAAGLPVQDALLFVATASSG